MLLILEKNNSKSELDVEEADEISIYQKKISTQTIKLMTAALYYIPM